MPDDPPNRQASPADLAFAYDVFISYSSKDRDWVRGPLLQRLEAHGLRVCIDFRDFQPGAPIVTEMERAVLTSRFTLVVLTPDFVNSNWTAFEEVLTFTLAHGFTQRRVIPLLKATCEPPLRIQALTAVDFTEPTTHEFAYVRLLKAIDSALAGRQMEQMPLDTVPAPDPIERPEEDRKPPAKQRKDTRKWYWNRKVAVVVALTCIILAIVVMDEVGSQPIAIDAELECGLGCTTMSPEGWEPRIPRVALAGQNIEQQRYQSLLDDYGPGRVLTFPMADGSTPVGAVTAALRGQQYTNACFKTEGPTIKVILRNTTWLQAIRVASLPILQMRSVEPLDQPVHTLYIVPEGVNFEHYMTTLRPMQPGEQLDIRAEGATENVAEHHLEPSSAPAALRIHLTCGAPGRYTLRLGINYIDGEEEKMAWFDKDFTVYSPSQYYHWIYQKPNVGVLTGVFHYEPSSDQWVEVEHPVVEPWVEKE